MDSAVLQAQRRLLVIRTFTSGTHRYAVHAAGPDGSPGGMVAFADPGRPAFAGPVTCHTDDTRALVLAVVTPRVPGDPASGHDVADAAGRPIGYLREDRAASRLHATWHLQQPGLPTLTGRERNPIVALARRRTGGPVWLPHHVEFGVGAHLAFTVERGWSARDRYAIAVDDHRLDRRLVIVAAIALDAARATVPAR